MKYYDQKEVNDISSYTDNSFVITSELLYNILETVFQILESKI